MCENCWIESGRPAIVNENVTEAARLIEELYDTEDGGVGGYGHIVFDDWNTEDRSISFCLDEANKNTAAGNLSENCRIASIAALNKFMELSEEERDSALALVSGFIKATP